MGNIQQMQNINNLSAYLRGGDCPAQELFIYDDNHDRVAAKIVFKKPIKTFKLSHNW